MMHLLKYCKLAVLFLSPVWLVAQDIQFSQPYSTPMYLNPAFAGSSEGTRLSMNYRNQWPGIDNNYQAYGAGADFYIREIKGGVGISFVRDIAGTHKLSNSLASIKYSQHIALSRKSTLALGVEAGIGQRQFDATNLFFADQVINESNVSQDAQNLFPAAQFADLSAGMMYFSTNLWLGVAVHHLTQPNQSLLGAEDKIPMKFSVHGGWVLPIEEFKDHPNKKSLRAMFNFKAQGKWDQLDIGAVYSVHGINMGMWYRGIPFKQYQPGYQNNEALVALLGYEFPKGLSIGYSYDLTLSRLSGHSGGAHEIAVIYELNGKTKKPRRRIVPCAKF